MKLSAEALKAKRQQLGLTQEVLAVRAGISKAALQYLEQDRREARDDTIEKLAAALGVAVAELTVETDEEVAS
jgi:transcriptional regulator with XRE-family HTH domain